MFLHTLYIFFSITFIVSMATGVITWPQFPTPIATWAPVWIHPVSLQIAIATFGISCALDLWLCDPRDDA